MKRILQSLLVIALAVGAWFLWSWLYPTPERAIRRQMDKLQEALVVKPGEGNFARVAAINRAVAIFTSDVVINTEGIPQMGDAISGRTELQQALFSARSRLQGEVNFDDIHITLGPEETNATVAFTAVARLANLNDPYSQDLKAKFVKIERQWLISRVDPIAFPATSHPPAQ